MNKKELKELQLKIIKKDNKVKLIGLMVYLIMLLVFIVICILNDENFDISYIVLFLIVTIIYFIIFIIVRMIIVKKKDIDLFKKEYKKLYVLNSLKKVFTDIEYHPNKGFDEDFIKKIGMIDTGDYFNTNDYISGKYKNINFEQSDMVIEEKETYTDSDGNTQTRWITLFEGRILKFDFNKNFKFDMCISTGNIKAEKLIREYSRIELEDTEFNKIFSVHAENQHEAFYILTPHFMEKMKNIYKKLNCDLMFCFVKNKLYVLVNNDFDSFEHNVFEPIDENEIQKDIDDDIALITDLIDSLNLDNDLFKEEV